MGFGHWLSVFTSSVVLRWRHCSDQTWTEVCDRLRFVSRWRIVKCNKSFVNYWLKHDGMIVRIHVPRSLLLALTSKFYFAKVWIAPYILRNVDDWTRRKLKTIFWLHLRFRIPIGHLVSGQEHDVRNKFLVRVAKTRPRLHVHVVSSWHHLKHSNKIL